MPENTIGLSFADWLIIAIYFAFVIGIGFYLKKFTKNENDFFLYGQRPKPAHKIILFAET